MCCEWICRLSGMIYIQNTYFGGKWIMKLWFLLRPTSGEWQSVNVVSVNAAKSLNVFEWICRVSGNMINSKTPITREGHHCVCIYDPTSAKFWHIFMAHILCKNLMCRNWKFMQFCDRLYCMVHLQIIVVFCLILQHLCYAVQLVQSMNQHRFSWVQM